MSIVAQDVRLSIRQLSRRPIFSFTAVVTLAIGMGVNAVAFTVVNGLLFNGPATKVGDDVGRIATSPARDENDGASVPEYQRFATATRGALDLAAEGRLAVAWRHDGATDTAWALFVSPNYFSMLDARPIAGRIEVARGAGGPPSAVIGERFWRRQLHGASIAGLTLRFNNTDVSITGVLPETFTGPAGLYSPDVWLPLDDLSAFHTSPALLRRDDRWLFVLGRLQAGVSVPEVQGRLDAAVNAMAREWPDTHARRGARFRLLHDGNSERRGLATAAAIAMGVIGLVLLLACFNVANLLLARAVERERDMGIRAALGAGATRLVRLVITEGVVLAAIAGAAALLLARWTQTILGSFAIPIDEPQHIDLTPNGTVVAFVALLVLVAGVLPGLWPALNAARIDVLRVLGSQGANAAGGQPTTLRRWLVGTQIAGSTAFLAMAALLVQSYRHLEAVDLGFARNELIVAELQPAAHGSDVERAERSVEALAARVRGMPGVADVAIADRVPFYIGFDELTPVSSGADSCDADTCPKYATFAVAPGYFRTMGIALAAGREFEPGDASAGVVINQPLARLVWPDGRGLGEMLRVGERQAPFTVIGITAKTHARGLDREQPTLYVPLKRDRFDRGITIVARTDGMPEALVRPVADAAQALDGNVPLLSLKTMERRIDVQLWPFRTVTWLFSICGTLALVLAVTGLAGVVIYAVNRRLREFGVRVSVGATPRDLVSDVLRSTGRLLAPGLLVGTLAAASGAQLVRAGLIGVDVLNPWTYVAVAATECAVVAVACVSPALRAARVDPLIALRSE